MHHYFTSISLCVALGIVTFACGSAVPPQSPIASQAETSRPDQASIKSPKLTPASAEEPEPESASAESEVQTPPAQTESDSQISLAALRHKATPIDVITGRETAYLIDYANSGAIAAATVACADQAKKVETAAWSALAEKAAKEVRDAKPKPPPKTGDAKQTDSAKSEDSDPAIEAAEAEEAAIAEKVEAVRTECLRASREKFEADVLRFRRDGLGHIKLVIYRRNGSSLKELYVANVELDDSSGNKVKVEIKEAGSGKRPIMRDRSKFELVLPNEYSLEFEDPQFGKLPYIAKVGLVAN